MQADSSNSGEAHRQSIEINILHIYITTVNEELVAQAHEMKV
jgi:hypothetical protein